MNILHLPLKKQWYDMIERGEKLEEYRDINAYWLPRLVDLSKRVNTFKPFTHVRFRYGYTKRTMLREIESISVGYGRPEWGAPSDRRVYIIKFKPHGPDKQ